MSYGSCPLLCNLEIFGLQVVEEVASLQVFHDNVNEIRVLKDIVKTNDICKGILPPTSQLSFPSMNYIDDIATKAHWNMGIPPDTCVGCPKIELK